MERLTKYVLISAGVMLFGFFAHNLWYAILGWEDAVFLALMMLGFLSMVILSIITAYSVIRKGRPRDAWILGFIGVALEVIVIALVIAFDFTGFNRLFFYLMPLPFMLFFIQYFRR